MSLQKRPEPQVPEALRQVLMDLRASRQLIAERADTLIRSRKALRASWEHYSQFHNSLPSGFLVFDEKGTIRNINASAARLLGLEITQVPSTKLGSYVVSADQQ